MKSGNNIRSEILQPCATVVLFFFVFLLPAQSLLAEEKEPTQLPIAEEEVQTAFQILESYIQGQAIPLETGGSGWSVVGAVVGVGANVGMTWVSLLPAVNNRSVSDFYGAYTGSCVGLSAQVAARSIARLAYPPVDIRAAYSSVLDVVDPQQRERAALDALKDINESWRNRRTLGTILSILAIAAPMAVHRIVTDSMDKLDEYYYVVAPFVISTGVCLLGSLNLFGNDAPALLYEKYKEQRDE